MFTGYIESPIGTVKIVSNGKGITHVEFVNKSEEENEDKFVKIAKQQLSEYFDNKRETFDVNLIPEGTSFEKDVWNQLLKIPYGFTTNYGNIAARLGDKKLAQAVGHANGKNPISIIIPCHRVIGKNNKLVGYSGGIFRKEWLLMHEGAILI